MNAITVEISKMTLAPGDVVVLRTRHVLKKEVRDGLREVLRPALPDGVACVVLDDGMEMAVFTAEGVRK